MQHTDLMFASPQCTVKSLPRAFEQDSYKSSHLPPSDDESVRTPILDDTKPSTSLQSRDQCSLSIGRTMLSSHSHPSISTHSTTDSPDTSIKFLHFQQSLLISIHLHLLGRLPQTSSIVKHYGPCFPYLDLVKNLPTFFYKVGYLSRHFFESAFQAVGVFFQTNTLYLESKDIHQLFSFASLFGADVTSIFLDVDGTFKVEDYLEYSSVISGLDVYCDCRKDLEVLNETSIYFPRLDQLHVHIERTIYADLVELLKVNTTVTCIGLSFKDIRDEGAIALADVLKVNTTVKRVELSHNDIGYEGIFALSEALKVNTTVTRINLMSNFVGEQGGAQFLADALKVNTSVTSVDLATNFIGDEGASALADALKINTAITSVDLSENGIGDEGASALADALKVNTAITSVDLGGNSIGDEGARKLSEMLKVNTTLTRVSLWNNSIGVEGADALADALKVNTFVSLEGVDQLDLSKRSK
ncbi:hypothetical protein GEMRC1_010157 [Eukaryota sp. GEM-RC1]